jgi:dTMP kinase
VARGRFLTLEGIDGAGKTIGCDVVVAALEAEGIEVEVTREPGGTPLAESIRRLLTGEAGESGDEVMADDTEALLMFAARAQHLHGRIFPALKAGRWVVSDRFTDATYAYQGGGRGMDRDRISALEQWTQADFRPDRTLWFDVSVATGTQRRAAAGRGEDRIEGAGSAFLERVRAVYAERAAAEPNRIRRVNAEQPPEAVAAELRRLVSEEVAAWRAGD